MNLVRLEAQEGNDGGREGYHTKDLVWQSYDVVVILQQLLFKYNNDLLAISHQSFMTGKKSTAQKKPRFTLCCKQFVARKRRYCCFMKNHKRLNLELVMYCVCT